MAPGFQLVIYKGFYQASLTLGGGREGKDTYTRNKIGWEGVRIKSTSKLYCSYRLMMVLSTVKAKVITLLRPETSQAHYWPNMVIKTSDCSCGLPGSQEIAADRSRPAKSDNEI